MPLEILQQQQQQGLVAVNKPAGLLVIPGRDPNEGPCVRELLARQLGQPVWVVHRIDRETSGVLVFATDAEAHRKASMAFEHGDARKQYLALVLGAVKAPLDIELALVPGRKGKMRVAGAGEEGKASRTVVEPVTTWADASLVRCLPHTGRQHQIRVHLAAKGHPLLFDAQYGRKEPYPWSGGALTRTPLHAAELELPTLGFRVTAPAPVEWAQGPAR